MENEQPGYREVIEEIAADRGIEHGSGMPTEGGDDFPEPNYEQSAVGHHLYTWHDDVTKEMFRVQIAHPVRSGLDFWCILNVSYRRDKNANPVSILNNKRWNLTSTSNTDGHIRSLNRRMKNRGWDARLTLIEQHLNSAVEIGDDLIDLSSVEDPPPAQYTVWPFVEYGEHNIIAADGGSTLSLIHI